MSAGTADSEPDGLVGGIGVAASSPPPCCEAFPAGHLTPLSDALKHVTSAPARHPKRRVASSMVATRSQKGALSCPST
jgi:hypothetical protein